MLRTTRSRRTTVRRGSAPTARAPARLLVVTSEGASSVPLPERGELILGRAPESDVLVDDPSVSRRHARLVVDGATLTIEDLGSANGTRVRGTTLERGKPAALRHGEAVELGDVTIVARAAPTTMEQASGATREARGDGAEDVALEGAGGAIVVRASPAVDRVLRRIARSSLSVLIVGETGAGKEVLAERLHAESARAGGPLVKVSCAALPEALLEGELFGHERGAFTGAVAPKPGLLEAADGGTLFLDELGELTSAVQAKLLRVLEDRRVLRLGSLKPRSVDVRFVAATNRDLEALAAAGAFRRDLYFRLAGVVLEIPPLRERVEEIPELSRRFARAARGEPDGSDPLSAEAVELLVSYAWPGNVRELKNVIERAALLCPEGPIRAAHLPAMHMRAYPSRPSAPPSAPEASATRPRVDRAKVVEALERCAGNQTRAAALLGISRRTLTNWLNELGMPRPRKGR